jgi:protein-S-isoprenylcysteine O-methyltransferase Ste14
MFELLAAFSWAVTGGLANGAWPYLYFFFLTVLLLHRVFRDEERCAKKYGDKWAEYCRAVPYRMIRYVW